MSESRTLTWRSKEEKTDPDRKTKTIPAAVKSEDHRRSDKPKRRNNSEKIRAKIEAEGFGRMYVKKQIREKTEMIFVLYDRVVRGEITHLLTYALDTTIEGQKQRIQKTAIQFIYKHDHHSEISPKIAIDKSVRGKRLGPTATHAERVKLDPDQLQKLCDEKSIVKIVMRGGGVIVGTIEWFSKFDAKVKLQNTTRSVVLFFHSIHNFEVIS